MVTNFMLANTVECCLQKQVIAFFSPTLRKTKSFYLFKYGKEGMGFVSGIKGVKAQVVLRTTARARVPVPEPEPVRVRVRVRGAAHSRIVRFSAHFALRTCASS